MHDWHHRLKTGKTTVDNDVTCAKLQDIRNLETNKRELEILGTYRIMNGLSRITRVTV